MKPEKETMYIIGGICERCVSKELFLAELKSARSCKSLNVKINKEIFGDIIYKTLLMS